MRYTKVVSTLMAMTLSLGGLAVAQGGGYRDNRRDDIQDTPRNDSRYQGRSADRWHQDNRYHNQRPDRQAQGHERPQLQFYRGQRLPAQYRQKVYVVNDWRSHHLHAPQRGQHWVQSGGDYILVGIATGVIVELLLNH